MQQDAKDRIDLLVSWVKTNRPDLCKDGSPDAALLASETGKKSSYWYDLLRKQEGRSFAAKSARAIEDALRIPYLYLEGSGWPFEEVDQERYEALTDIQKGRVQQALNEMLDKIEAEKAARAHPLGKDDSKTGTNAHH
jgi:hypothetical protein